MAKVSDPIKIGGMELKNRLVTAPLMAPTWGPDGLMTEAGYDLYRERAAGGASMVCVHGGGMAQQRDEIVDGKIMLRLWETDAELEKGRRLAQIVHEEGAKVSIQIGAGGRQNGFGPAPGTEVFTVSDKTPSWAARRSRGLTLEDVDRIINWYVDRTVKAKEMGYDAVLYHGAHGFLITQFYSPYTNVGRDDRYGRDRAAFAVDIIKRTREAVGPDYPIMMRFSVWEGVYGGNTPKLLAEDIIPHLVEAGLDCIDISAGNFEKFYWVGQPIYFQRGVLLPGAEELKKVTDIPIVAAGRINDPRFARKILAEERVDIVALGRTIMADPDFPRKTLEGRDDEITQCIACGECFIVPGVIPAEQQLSYPSFCAVNPFLGRPAERKKTFATAPRSKKVLIIGGGVGGMQAAEVAARRGHDVTLCEKGEKLGGLVNLASHIPMVYTRELSLITKELERKLNQLEVKVNLSTEVTSGVVQEMAPDVVIVATGSVAELPDIPGIEKSHVITEDEYLVKHPELGEQVVVIGGARGAEIALSIARQGKFVTILEASTDEAVLASPPWMTVGPRWRQERLLEMIHEEVRIRIRIGIRVKQITDDAVIINWNNDTWEETLRADNVVVTVGRKPVKDLAEELEGLVPEVYKVGDCVEPRLIFAAIHEAARVAGSL